MHEKQPSTAPIHVRYHQWQETPAHGMKTVVQSREAMVVKAVAHYQFKYGDRSQSSYRLVPTYGNWVYDPFRLNAHC